MARIFLNPSSQAESLYPNGGDEQYWMNKIAEAVERYLAGSGVETVRSAPGTSTDEAIRQSNSGLYDLHLALHSSTAPPELTAKIKGPDVYFYQYSQNGGRAADIISENLKKIYPEPDLVDRVPISALMELGKTIAPAVVVKLAYHDNPQDEAWIVNNIEQIAENLSRSAAEYLGVAFQDA